MDEHDFPNLTNANATEIKATDNVAQDAFVKDLNTMSEVFGLRKELATAKTMLIELQRQRDEVRKTALDYATKLYETESALREIDAGLIAWTNRSPWQRFWSTGAIINAIWQRVADAL